MHTLFLISVSPLRQYVSQDKIDVLVGHDGLWGHLLAPLKSHMDLCSHIYFF